MPIWLDVDTAVTVPVNVLPLIDDTDFKSIEGSVAYNAAGMTLHWIFVTTAGVITSTAVTPTTGGVYDWTGIGISTGMYKIEIPASGGGDNNNDAEGYGWFTGIADGILPWSGPRIGFRDAGINNKLVDAMYNTARGLAGTALPNATADATGGLPISDAGGLDLDDLPKRLDRNADLIESQRGSHTWQGNYYYVDPVNGDTHASGNRGGRADPYKTIQDCHDNAVTDNNHDVIFLVSGAASGPTTHTVAATTTISKDFVFLRGPGRNFIITRTGSGDTIAITGDGVEVAGARIGTAATGSGDGIDITDADFARIHHCWFLDTRGDGVHILRGSNCQIHDNDFDGTGVAGSGDGIHIVGTAGSSNHNTIFSNEMHDVLGDAILIEQGTTNDTLIFGNDIHDSGGWGINIGASSNRAVLYDNVLGNNSSGDITDSGTDSIIKYGLDVNATGEAGLDFDNTSGTLDAAQFGADFLTNAKIADDAFAASQFATGAFTADAFAADALVAATFATGAFTADAFAADALIAATFATDSITTDALAASALQDIAQIAQKTAGVVYHVKSSGGSDGAGLSWDDAYLHTTTSVKTVIEAASANDVVLLGPGTFALGDNVISVPNNVSVYGAGMEATHLTSTASINQASEGAIVNPGNRSVIGDMTIEGTLSDGSSQGPIGSSDFNASQKAFNDAVGIRLKLVADADGVYIRHASACSLTLIDSMILSKFDAVIIADVNGVAVHTVDVINCSVLVYGPSAVAANVSHGIRIGSTAPGRIRVFDSHVRVEEGGSIETIGLQNEGTGTIEMYGGSIYAFDATGNVYAVSNESTGAIIIAGVEYDRSQTNGTITEVSGLDSAMASSPTADSLMERIKALDEGTAPPIGIAGTVDDGAAAVGDFDGDSALSASDNFYNNAFLVFTGGTLKGIGRQISGYNGTSKNFTFTGSVGDADEPFPVAPANSDPFIILGRFGA